MEWDERSEVFSIENISNGTFDMLLEGLNERSYEFKVYCLDAEGNKSIEQIVTGRAMGEIFKSFQAPRRIVGYAFSQGSLAMKWADKAESEFVIKTEVLYDNNDGDVNSLTVFPEDLLTNLENWKQGGNIKIVSSVITGLDGIDTLELNPTYDKLPSVSVFELDKSLIQLAHMLSDNPGTGYGANPDQFLFDGDAEYISDIEGYHSDEEAIPHHLTIDLGVICGVRKVRVDLRTDHWTGNNPTAVQLWGILDNTNAETIPADDTTFVSKGWIKLGEFTGLDETNPYHEFELAAGSPRIRFLRYRVTNSLAGAAQATEMTFWGENIAPVN